MSAADLKAKYPSMAYLIDNPEIGPILDQADREGWPPEKLQSTIEATSWWRHNASSVRSYLDLQATDPASLQRAHEQKREQILKIGIQQGIYLTWDQLNYYADQALMFGWDDNELQQTLIYNSGGQLGAQAPAGQLVRQLAAQYFMPLDDATAADWTRKIASGQYTSDNFKGQLESWAKVMFPHLASQLDSGLTMADIAAPYKNQIANLMEVAPDSIDMVNDPRWRNAIDTMDDHGNHRMMSLYELQQYVKQQPEWWKTSQANQQAADVGQTLLKQLGQVA